MATAFALLDFETTGLHPNESEIIEIGLIQVTVDETGWHVVDRWSQLVRPKHPVPRPIRQLTGITDEELAQQPTWEEVWPIFSDRLGDHVLVAHNAMMEQGFLDAHLTPLTQKSYVVANSIDPLALIFPDQMSVSLESFRRWAKIHRENSHRALADCEDLYEVLEKAWHHAHGSRPELSDLVGRHLGDWWWQWFFVPPPRESVATPDVTPAHGTAASDPTGPVPEELSIFFEEQLPQKGLGFRDAQWKMAQSVWTALKSGERLAIEAPTGTGKSLAYLAPAAWMAQHAATPVVVATHSKTLQDQLLEKDIPLVGARATTVKGQENYLCLRKLHDAVADLERSPAWEDRWCSVFLLSYAALTPRVELDRIARFVKSTFPGLSILVERVRSHHSTTLGSPCPFYERCHFFNAARMAAQSEILITNHALAFRWPQHLPKLEHVIFDEAHHLEDQITQAYTLELRDYEVAGPLDRLTSAGGRRGIREFERIETIMAQLPSPPDWTSADLFDDLTQVKMRLEQWKTLLPSLVPKKGDVIINPLEGPVLEPLVALKSAMERSLKKLQTLEEAAKSLGRRGDRNVDTLKTYLRRLESAFEVLEAFTLTTRSDVLRTLLWTLPEAHWTLKVEPISVQPLADVWFQGMKSIVLTSATLTSGSNPDFMLKRIGLTLSKPLQILPSPFQLEKQARVYFPNDLAPPGTAEHFQALVEFTVEATQAMRGRTLLLMTSNMRMRRAVEELRDRLEPLGIEVHDSLSDPQAHEAFRDAHRGDRQALLIGSEKLGEGLDIPGAALSLVILEKINEAMTRGPLAQARSAQTKFGLYDYEFPLRMIWLRQRVGRLIRSQTDAGAVVVLDSRPSKWAPASKSQVFKALHPIPVEESTRDNILKNLEYLDVF